MISSIKIVNFKCFEDQKIGLKPLTLLSGLNGMGKSSLLQALLLLRQSFQQELLDKTGLALNGELVNIGTAQDALYEDAEKDIIGFELNLNDKKHGKWLFKYNKEADVLDLVEALKSSDIYKCNLFSDQFHYLQAERISPRRSY